MSGIKIKDFSYKNINGVIRFASGKDWGSMKNKFYFDGAAPFCAGILDHKEIDVLEKRLKEEYDKWESKNPKTDDDWVDLVSSCVIQDGYEDWHVDKNLLMQVLEKYRKIKNFNQIDGRAFE